jgi:hypothetical protein
MRAHASATFSIAGWDEDPYAELEDGAKFTRATVKKTFRGEVEGEATLVYLMFYDAGGVATFTGLEHFVGRIGERAGSFVMQRQGNSSSGVVWETFSIVPDSATGDLRGLRGAGRIALTGHAEEYPFELDYEL